MPFIRPSNPARLKGRRKRTPTRGCGAECNRRPVSSAFHARFRLARGSLEIPRRCDPRRTADGPFASLFIKAVSLLISWNWGCRLLPPPAPGNLLAPSPGFLSVSLKARFHADQLLLDPTTASVRHRARLLLKPANLCAGVKLRASRNGSTVRQRTLFSFPLPVLRR